MLHQEVQPVLDAYVSRAVEPYLGALFRTRWRHCIPFDPAFMGRHWGDGCEIDWLVLDHDRQHAVAVEVKWTGTPVNAAGIVAGLKAKVDSIDALRNCRTDLVVVSRAGFKETKSAAGCNLISLREEK